MIEPRDQHYLFAHRFLPHFFFDDPERFFEILENEGRRFLDWMWQRSGAQSDEGGAIAPEGLDINLFRFDERTVCACVTLPPPIGITEAYWVAAVYRPEERFTALYTLEFGYDLDGGTRTVLGGWDGEGTHFNFGTGPEADKHTFLDWVFEKVAKPA